MRIFLHFLIYFTLSVSAYNYAYGTMVQSDWSLRPRSLVPCKRKAPVIALPVGQTVTFTSPNYPNKYGKRSHCGWKFKSDKGSTFELSCSDFNLRPPTKKRKCRDVFKINDFKTHKKYCGKDNPSGFVSNGHKLNLLFNSKKKKLSTGFSCSVTAKGDTHQPTPKGSFNSNTNEPTTKDPPATTIAAPASDPPATTIAAPASDPPATTIAAPASDPPATTIAAPASDPPATTIAAPASDPPATTIAAPASDPPATTIAAPASDPPATTIAAPASDPPATTIAASASDPPATTIAAPASDRPAPTIATPAADHPPAAATTNAAPASECNKNVTITEITDETWKTQGYPEGYPEGISCTLTVTIPEIPPMTMATVTFEEPSSIIFSKGCVMDDLKYTSSAGITTRYCGDLAPQSWSESTFYDGPKIFSFTFTSSEAGGRNDTGFSLRIEGHDMTG